MCQRLVMKKIRYYYSSLLVTLFIWFLWKGLYSHLDVTNINHNVVCLCCWNTVTRIAFIPIVLWLSRLNEKEFWNSLDYNYTIPWFPSHFLIQSHLRIRWSSCSLTKWGGNPIRMNENKWLIQRTSKLQKMLMEK